MLLLFFFVTHKKDHVRNYRRYSLRLVALVPVERCKLVFGLIISFSMFFGLINVPHQIYLYAAYILKLLKFFWFSFLFFVWGDLYQLCICFCCSLVVVRNVKSKTKLFIFFIWPQSESINAKIYLKIYFYINPKSQMLNGFHCAPACFNSVNAHQVLCYSKNVGLKFGCTKVFIFNYFRFDSLPIWRLFSELNEHQIHLRRGDERSRKCET